MIPRTPMRTVVRVRVVAVVAVSPVEEVAAVVLSRSS